MRYIGFGQLVTNLLIQYLDPAVLRIVITDWLAIFTLRPADSLITNHPSAIDEIINVALKPNEVWFQN